MSETDIDRSSWLTKQQAADAIGVTTKTVERLAHAGKLQQASWSAQGRGPAKAVYHPADVARLAQERRAAPAAFVLPAGAAAPTNGNGRKPADALELVPPTPPGDEPLRMLFGAALRAVMSQTSQTPTVSQTLFVDLAEAAAITGLSQAYLRRLIDEGKLPSVRDRGRRIRRRDLEQL